VDKLRLTQKHKIHFVPNAQTPKRPNAQRKNGAYGRFVFLSNAQKHKVDKLRIAKTQNFLNAKKR
jgi:hypothetical protein